MDPTPTFQDTPIISRNTEGTKTGDGNLTDLTFRTFQNTPLSIQMVLKMTIEI